MRRTPDLGQGLDEAAPMPLRLSRYKIMGDLGHRERVRHILRVYSPAHRSPRVRSQWRNGGLRLLLASTRQLRNRRVPGGVEAYWPRRCLTSSIAPKAQALRKPTTTGKNGGMTVPRVYELYFRQPFHYIKTELHEYIQLLRDSFLSIETGTIHASFWHQSQTLS